MISIASLTAAVSPEVMHPNSMRAYSRRIYMIFSLLHTRLRPRKFKHLSPSLHPLTHNQFTPANDDKFFSHIFSSHFYVPSLRLQPPPPRPNLSFCLAHLKYTRKWSATSDGEGLQTMRARWERGQNVAKKKNTVPSTENENIQKKKKNISYHS